MATGRRRSDPHRRPARPRRKPVAASAPLPITSPARARDIDRYAHKDPRAWLAAIVAGADDPIISKTLDGVVTSWNGAAERMFGYTAAEAVGRSITLIIPLDRLPEERQILSRLRQGLAIEHFETERLTKDGRLIPVSLSVSPVRDSRGRIIGASKILRDISERRRAEAIITTTLQTLEALYRLADSIGRAQGRKDVCDAGVEAIVSVARADRASALVFDEAGVMRFCSWADLSDGYRAAVEGHSPWSPDTRDARPILVEDVLEAPELAHLREAITSEGIRAMAFIPLAYQGRLLGKFMIYYDAPHAFSTDELRLATTVAQHVSFGLARVHADEAIERLLRREQAARWEADAARRDAELANRAKDEFLAMLAHELRNPLGVIVNAIALIDASPELAPPARRASGMISRQAGHLTRLLDDLLDIARITSGRIELEREPVELRAAMGLAVDAHRQRLDAKRQQLTITLPDRDVTVLGDPVRLQQVLTNLVNNASKYTGEDGSIWLTLELEGDEAVVRVRDNGVGIPEDQLDSIFNLFAQANPTLARTEGGLGIGLTLVKRIVALHGGSVQSRSDGLGRGAEFIVRLPRDTAGGAAAASPVASLATAARRVLVIEDHDDGREVLVATLERHGHHVVHAAGGREGIDAALRCLPEVALIDIGLPDVDGYEVARTLRHRLEDRIWLVALTGYGQPQDRLRAEEAGFDAHLVKPIEPARLAEMLERLAPSPRV